MGDLCKHIAVDNPNGCLIYDWLSKADSLLFIEIQRERERERGDTKRAALTTQHQYIITHSFSYYY